MMSSQQLCVELGELEPRARALSQVGLWLLSWPRVPLQESQSIPPRGPERGSPCGTLWAGSGGLWSVPITHILGVSHPAPQRRRRVLDACATATGRALQSETSPIALSSLAGHGDFFYFFLSRYEWVLL